MASLLPHEGVLGTKLATHLLRRCTYNVTKAHIDIVAQRTAVQAVTVLFNFPGLSLLEPIYDETLQPWINTGFDPGESGDSRRSDYVAAWWIDEARQDVSIGHKMQFFLHSNFVVSLQASSSRQFFDYLMLLRHYKVGFD